MSDSPDASVVVDTPDAAAQQWLTQLATAPDLAVDKLLQGAVWLGAYAALDLPQALPQFVPEALIETLDGGLLQWLARRQRQSALPPEFSAKQFARALADAFGLMQSLSLPQSQSWCRQNAVAMWRWLGAQPSYPSREPRAAFLRAVALVQPNRDLLGFWLSLCRQAHARWAPLALFGLRRMPIDDDGTASPGLPLVLVSGLIDYGLALVQRAPQAVQQAAPLKAQWLAELDFLTAVYPMSQPRWVERFREALAPRKGAALPSLRLWLNERYPAANQAAPARSTRQQPLKPPHWDGDIQPLLGRFDGQQALVRPPLQAQMDRHLFYARESGDDAYLVMSFCRLASFLTDSATDAGHHPRDPGWALDLAQEAARWAPGNPRCWSAMAMALDAQGDWSRALAVFWYARRRFPYNDQAHSQLGHALMQRGLFAEGEAVYRAAIRRFPDNAVCWADLGHTLRTAGRLPESLAVYSVAQQRFHRDPAICNALAGVLIDLGRVDDARNALTWAEQVVPDDARNQQVLGRLRQRLGALVDGQAMPLQQLAPRPLLAATGDWFALERCAGMDLRGIDALGLGGLWRQRGGAGDGELARVALDDAATQLVQGRDDARWLVEQGLWLTANLGQAAGRAFFDQAVAAHPGDGVLAALGQRAHGQDGAAADWPGLWARFPELAPLLRLAQNPAAQRPVELQAALASVTQLDGRVKLDDLDEGLRQANWLYDTATSPDVADLAQQDFLAARQLMSG